jgi:N-acetylglucosamine-6-phosphate deacetylase
MNNSSFTVEGIHYMENIGVQITVKKGIIQSIEQSILENPNIYIAPGLVDLQVNGYMGIDFNDISLTESEIEKVCRFLAAEGVTTFYPTIITNSYENITKLVRIITDAIEKNDLVRKMVPGIHLEGPFLSMEDGPRGAHNKRFIQPPDWEFFRKLNDSANGLIKIVTLSPEWDNVSEFINEAVKNNVLVSIGHTSAATEQIEQAIKAGASLSTHLGNGAHVMLPRHPNYLWDQLANDSLAATVIADGFHLPYSVLKVIEKVKKEKMLIISDSVALAGLPPGHYETAVGGEVTLTKEGKLHLKGESKLLAGSAQSILWGVKTLTSMGVTSLSKAIDKASVLPAKLLNLPQKNAFKVGAPADFIFYSNKNKSLELLGTMKSGEILFTNKQMNGV